LPPRPRPAGGRKRYTTKRGLTLVNAQHITASVFINDDESGLHHDYEVWLERLAQHAPTDHYWHNRTGEDNADAHLKRAADTGCTSQIMGREVVAATNGRLDLGTWARIFQGQAEWLTRGSRRPAPQAGVGQEPQAFLRNHWGIGVLRATMSVIAYGSRGPQRRGGLYDKKAGAESMTLSLGLEFGPEPGGPIELCKQPSDVDQARSASDAGCYA
jgi:secondary thiamine-phosphate synthase enzyme